MRHTAGYAITVFEQLGGQETVSSRRLLLEGSYSGSNVSDQLRGRVFELMPDAVDYSAQPIGRLAMLATKFSRATMIGTMQAMNFFNELSEQQLRYAVDTQSE